jgi:hypothetical protein
MDTRIAHMERGMEVAKEARRHVTITAWTVAGVIGRRGASASFSSWLMR